MNKASKRKEPPTIKDISVQEEVIKTPTNYHNFNVSGEGQLTMTPQTNLHFQDPVPVKKLSPWHHGRASSLYDAYELKAITQHLTRVLREPQGVSSPYSCQLMSPFYPPKGCLGCVFKQNTRGSSNQVTGSQSSGGRPECKDPSWGTATTSNFIPSLYKKLKRTLM